MKRPDEIWREAINRKQFVANVKDRKVFKYNFQNKRMRKCELYEQGRAEKGYFLREENVFCQEKCPYNNQIKTTWQEEEISFCKSNGLIIEGVAIHLSNFN